MLKTTFTKTLYTKRWMLLAWGAGLLLLTIFTMLFFPTFKQIGESFKDVPDSLKSFLGDANTYKSIAGYADVQILSQYDFMTLILGVILMTGLLAGEEGAGTLQTLLVQPVSRLRVYIEKLFGGMAIIALVCLGISAGMGIGALLVHESIQIGRLLEAAFAMWLITMVFSGLGYALGAVMGRRGIAGGIAGVLAFISLLINSLAESVKGLRPVDKVLPFHYFNKPGVLTNGLDWHDSLILIITIIVPLVIAAFVFVRRDINQK